MRHHFIDSARAFLMLLGIPLHTALFYNDVYPWYLNSSDRGWVFFYIFELIHIFRMPAFFIAAGFLGALTLQKKGGTGWLKGRMGRLAIPLVTAFLLISIPQYLLALSNGFDPQELRTDNLLGHLWFLIVLIEYSIATVVLEKLGVVSKIIAFKWNGSAMVAVVTAAAVVSSVVGRASGFVVDGPLLSALSFEWAIIYFPFYLLGLLCGTSQQWFGLLRGKFVSVGLAGGAAAAVFLAMPMPGSFAEKIVHTGLGAVAAVFISLTIFRIFERYLNIERAIIGAVVAASFTIYLFHHPLVMLFGLALEDTVHIMVRFFVVVLAAGAISYGIHLIVASNDLLSYAFNGASKRKRKASQAVVRRPAQ